MRLIRKLIYIYHAWKYDRHFAGLVRERYKVVSEIGVNGLKEIIKLKESGLDYWDSVYQLHKERMYYRRDNL